MTFIHPAEVGPEDNYLDTLCAHLDTIRRVESDGADALHAFAGELYQMIQASAAVDPDARGHCAKAVRRRLRTAASLMDAAAKMVKAAERELVSGFEERPQRRGVEVR